MITLSERKQLLQLRSDLIAGLIIVEKVLDLPESLRTLTREERRQIDNGRPKVHNNSN